MKLFLSLGEHLGAQQEIRYIQYWKLPLFHLCNNSVVEKTNRMTFNPTATLKLVYLIIYHQSSVAFKNISSIKNNQIYIPIFPC